MQLTYHSKLRPNYPTPKIPKNCASHQIKSGKSPRYRKVREGQKSGCSPGSNRENSQKPHWQTVTKMHLKRINFLTLECVPKGSQGTKMYSK